MGTIELFVSSILIAFTVGVIFAAVAIDIWCIRPLIRQQEDHRAFWRDLSNDRVARARQEGRHLGTPYRAERVVAANDALLDAIRADRVKTEKTLREIGHPSGKPGLRVVEGHTLYSADFLNDEARA